MNTPTIIKGSILDFEGDCIVNPANSFLRHGGGLAHIIEKGAKGGFLPSIESSRRNASIASRGGYTACLDAWRRDHAYAPLIATGNAHATSAGLLPFNAVIHTVGPVYNGGHFCERSLLASAYSQALRVAEGLGYESIAFPAVSCGEFGYPVAEAAGIAVAALLFTNLDVSLYLFSDDHVAAFTRAVQAVTA